MVDFNLLGSLKQNWFIEKEMFTILPDEEKLVIGSLPKELEGEQYTTCDLVETNDLADVFRAGWICLLTSYFLG